MRKIKYLQGLFCDFPGHFLEFSLYKDNREFPIDTNQDGTSVRSCDSPSTDFCITPLFSLFSLFVTMATEHFITYLVMKKVIFLILSYIFSVLFPWQQDFWFYIWGHFLVKFDIKKSDWGDDIAIFSLKQLFLEIWHIKHKLKCNDTLL